MNADAQFAVADASTAADPLHAMVVRMGEHVDAAAVSTVDAKNAEVAPGATAPVKMALSFADAARELDSLQRAQRMVDVVIADPWSAPGVDESAFLIHWHRIYPALSFIVVSAQLGDRARGLRHRLGRDHRVLFLADPFDPIELRQLLRLIRVQRRPAALPATPADIPAAAPAGFWRVHDDEPTSAQSRWAFERALDRALLDQDKQHTLCIFSVDRFHALLDRFGAAAQASILRRIRTCIVDAVRGSDRVARLGEEEFALLLSNTDSTQGAKVAEKVLARIHDLQLKWRDADLNLTLSAGVTDTTQQDRKIADLISAADTALQAARAAGGDKVRVYRQEDSDLVKKREQSNSLPEIEAALSAGRFKLYAQLIVPLTNADKIHAEFLVRMVDAGGEMWPPSKFLPVAERFGIAPRFDRWVFERTLTLLREWGGNAPHLGHVSVNLSGQTLMDEVTLEWIESRYRQEQLPRGAVCFEITETAAIDSWSVASSFIDRMRSHGALFSLDDFGAGFSSFAYLEAVPTDYLKIDGSFVRQCLTQPRQLELVRTLNEIGHLFGKQTVAEFVENEELLGVVRGMGVDCAQGYFTGPPIPAENLLEAIDAYRAGRR